MPQVRISPAHRNAVSRFEKAAIAKSWIGSQPPEDHAAIEAEYEKAKTLLLNRGRLKQEDGSGSSTFVTHQKEFDAR